MKKDKKIMFTELDKVMTVFQNFLIQKQYSPNTIKTYCNYFKDYLSYFKGSEYQNITKDLINRYVLTLVKEKKISVSQQNQRINAIKFYYEKVLKRKKEYYNIERPRKEQKLPNVLSKNEIAKILEIRLMNYWKERKGEHTQQYMECKFTFSN